MRRPLWCCSKPLRRPHRALRPVCPREFVAMARAPVSTNGRPNVRTELEARVEARAGGERGDPVGKGVGRAEYLFVGLSTGKLVSKFRDMVVRSFCVSRFTVLPHPRSPGGKPQRLTARRVKIASAPVFPTASCVRPSVRVSRQSDVPNLGAKAARVAPSNEATQISPPAKEASM